jgi:hypothetical protein
MKSLIERVHDLFLDMTKYDIFDDMSGTSDLTHPDEINRLCDDVALAVKQIQDTHLYTVLMKECVEPQMYGPFLSEQSRRDHANATLVRGDCILRLDIKNGNPSVRPFFNGEIKNDNDKADQEQNAD